MSKSISANALVTELALVGETKASLLSKIGITTIRDMLFHIPFKYRDTSNIIPISQLKEEEEGVILATVLKIENIYTRYRKVFTRARVEDESGSINIVWFNQTYLTKSILVGEKYIFEGKISSKSNDLTSPSYEKYQGDIKEQSHIGKITPYYNETAGISSKWLRSRIATLKQEIPNLIIDPIPQEIISKQGHITTPMAIQKVHFPESFNDITEGRARLAFDEMLGVAIKTELNIQSLKNRTAPKIEINTKALNQFISSLPYTLTHDQRSSLDSILEDIQEDTPMNRLLNGDVGSGKTIVAAASMYMAYIAGYSSVILAPTTILASQHKKTLDSILKPFNIEVKLRISGIKKELDTKPAIIVGTHALLYDTREIYNLGILIVDEQHRFGVKQREQLTQIREDGKYPHFLMMSATPIPHTLTNIIFGDMQVSFIRELPPYRIPIESHFVPNNKRESCLNWIKEKIIDSKFTEQAFIIFPLIEESEKLEVKAATVEYEKLSQGVFRKLKVGILHGQMKSEEKEQILNDFKEKKFNILVSTSVVEVGIDIPDATIMVIEDAQRFGLAQLHQFRGRVGRGKLKSYCYVLAGEDTPQTALDRLKFFASHASGFDVAEYDLQKRGPGEVYGLKQSGIPSFKVASINDISLLIQARDIAKHLYILGEDLEKIHSNLFR